MLDGFDNLYDPAAVYAEVAVAGTAGTANMQNAPLISQRFDVDLHVIQKTEQSDSINSVKFKPLPFRPDGNGTRLVDGRYGFIE